MPTPRRPGRPKAPLPAVHDLLTRQARRLIDQAHLGNLREAAAHAGLPYGTVRDLYLGPSLRPSAETLHAMATAYGLSLDWFLNEASSEEPVLAIVATLPPDPEFRRGRLGRQFSIPLAAWPLARLVLRLERAFGQRPPLALRALIGPVREPEAIRQQIVIFLIGPLLDAQRVGLATVLGAEPPYPGTHRVTEGQQAAWITTLRQLGEFWESVLDHLIAEDGGRG